MKEPFDKKLSQRIKTLFENHQESPSEKEWGKFAAAYFNKPTKKPLPIWTWWVSGIAASLLLIGWFINSSSKVSTQSELLSLADSLANESEKFTLEASGTIELPDQLMGEVEAIASLQSGYPSAISPRSKTELTQTNHEPRAIDQLLTSPSEEIPMIPENEIEAKESVLKTAPIQLTTEEASAYIRNLLGDNESPPESSKLDPFKIGVLLAPQTVSNTNQTLGLSAGIMSEFSLTKKLKIDMGIAYAQQNLNPNPSGNLLNTSVNDALEAAFVNQQVRSQYSLGNQLFAGNLMSIEEELRFGQIEIPINLKYKLFERTKADIYFVSGISNMLYLNQKRISTLNFASFSTNNIAGNGLQSFSQSLGPDASGSTVNLGQLINVAVGFEQSLNNGTFVYIEPFYKISVGGQTFAEQQFSIGGINLRMNFQLKK
jgi:hypothetical protein